MRQIHRIREVLGVMRRIAEEHENAQGSLEGYDYARRAAALWGQGNARIRLLDEYARLLGKVLEDLDDAYTDVVTMHAQEVEGLRRDILTLVGRVYGEDESTYAPETAEVMRRWESQWHREYQRQVEEVAHGAE